MNRRTGRIAPPFGALLLWSVFLWSFWGCAFQREAMVENERTATPAAERHADPRGETSRLDDIDPTGRDGDNSEDSPDVQAELDEALSLCHRAQELWQRNDPEEALDSLDRAFALILAVEPDDDPELIRQKEDLRFMISKRIMEIYASRSTKVTGKHRPIPMDMNPYVEKEIEHLTRGNFFRDAYRRSGRYRDMIVEELEKAGLPGELVWLPLIESGYRVNAFSSARALGLWQFIPSTGYKFGLKRDRFIDERMDPEKSTRAAVAYLKELHNIFGDWSTVLAAYNCGEGRVLNVIRTRNVNYLDNFWDLYERLPRETARYVPRFLATLHILQDPDKYGIDLRDREAPPETESLTVSRQVCLNRVAREIGVPPDRLKSLNPELRGTVLPPGPYAIRVPVGKASDLLAKIDEIPTATESAPARAAEKTTRVAYHRVRRGETLSVIARRHGVTMKDLMRANRIHRSHYIVAGKVLKIPGARVSAPSPARRRASHTVYVVQKGDSLWNIARKHGTSTSALTRLNNLSGNDLSIGQVLKIPGQGTAKVNPGELRTYRVRTGDIPMEIARRHRMSLERFLEVNRLNPRSTIFPGQEVYVD
jgi:membrane-bound lytic murein transglycosylase D